MKIMQEKKKKVRAKKEVRKRREREK